MKQLIVSLSLVALAMSGCTAKPQEPESEAAAPTEVKAATVAQATLRPSLELAGTLTAIPELSAVLTPQVAGQVTQVPVREGQAVRVGETIAQLDMRTVSSDLAKAKAALQEAQANLAMLERGPLPQEIEAARQDAQSAASTAQSQSAKLKALEPLHAQGEISGVQFEQARAAAAGAEATSAAAQQRLKLLEAGSRTEVLEQARAKRASAEAEVAAQQLALELSRIQSPIDGVITELPVRQGMYVDRPTIIARIADLSRLHARIRIPSKSRAQLQEGAEASVGAGASGTALLPGQLVRIGKEADTQTGEVEAFVEIRNEKEALQPGLPCTARLQLPEIANALLVPVAAVANRDGNAVVTRIQDGKAHETRVEVGIRSGDVVQILDGLAAGDLVATEGGYALPDGCPVKVLAEAPPAP